ncbi:hypothetical protein [Xanthomonas vesicatoria]|uniref:Uncharacterized protein n=2 Tax=Xanthomonas vesicatoria TaxID=56460 RepID=A0AAJ0N5F9_9XANT|nr:hypothetical protein [Xanthomonas vesicatoria]APO96027.1 hypothetical protein BI313_16830 [Xanthomonas vesicatoria]APP76123.1 hypothetical protein BJD12_13820 [Xanthomonas vesicatoria ATCC 35937]EGD11001.1 hypothetical protein XVE_0560 [Xanthomonas vesicatoria ATCC 35937]KHM93004.1 hypothetical protein OR60_15050 [Xanthomonas vesicatoria]KHM96854.1 hypothetical protein OR61_05375 [Xanthomonas vesicatoria]
MSLTQQQLFVFALYKIRRLLAGRLGSHSASPLSVRAAAHLADALHNAADTVLQGRSFDPESVATRLGAVGRMLGTTFQQRLSDATRDLPQTHAR